MKKQYLNPSTDCMIMTAATAMLSTSTPSGKMIDTNVWEEVSSSTEIG